MPIADTEEEEELRIVRHEEVFGGTVIVERIDQVISTNRIGTNRQEHSGI